MAMELNALSPMIVSKITTDLGTSRKPSNSTDLRDPKKLTVLKGDLTCYSDINLSSEIDAAE